ncbi:GntR family transcriptional regulator [Rubrobacter indicoceani]|uniref:GntR family transcriptional regulator n=1 Tax=Rubrobacter indicoceani TaxID=2051957 RepID=UPI000E5B05D8|nr:GntR family transcriptional regulator [Rubrobacter indicoceani]
MAVSFEVDGKSGVPIYVQLAAQVRRSVEVGALGAGDRLPTVRALAGELSIAPNTIVKAYGELQRDGFIESRPGVGTVVASGVAEVSSAGRREAFGTRLREVVRDASSLGISQDDLWEMLDREYEERS